MDNLRKSIKLYFEGLDPDKILNKRALNSSFMREEDYVSDFSTFKTSAFAQSAFDTMSNDELENIHQKVVEDWMFAPYTNNRETKSPFHLLSHFTKQVLTEVESQPFVQYHHLLKWRDMTLKLGEDVFTASFLAQRDIIARKKRTQFSWRPILFSDNQRLHELLQQGVAENHSHLWASGLTFDLSWLALMNHYPSLKDGLREFQATYSLYGKTSHQFNTEKVEYLILLRKAIVLRLLLYKAIGFYQKEDAKANPDPKHNDLRSYLKDQSILGFDCDKLFHESNTIDSFELSMEFPKVQEKIEALGQFHGLKLPHRGQNKYVDYALDKNIHPANLDGCFYLAGERTILYNAFKVLYTRLENKQDVYLLEKFLHSYLVIKNIFRKEIIQLNERYGFGNFQDYQNRKMIFIPDKSIYQTIFLDISLNYNRGLMNILSNEYRITPSNNALKLKKDIENILRIRNYNGSQLEWKKQLLGTSDHLKYIKEEKKHSPYVGEELYFVLHFLKRKDKLIYKKGIAGESKKKNIEIQQYVTARDHVLRSQVKQQAQGIKEFREKFPEYARYVKGIDAASSEACARPEAFAQAFRFLKHHQLRSENDRIKGYSANNKLHITFHAGEDFLDVVDGMRYIDECVRFLGMSHGDRFGHALAIGINVRDYYDLKHRKIILSKNMLLDNVAWLLSKVRKFGLTRHLDEVYKLENLFKDLYSEIYLNGKVCESIRMIHYQQFYDAWKLRGDDPYVYFDVFSGSKSECKHSKTNLNETGCGCHSHKDEKFAILDLSKYFDQLINITYWERCRLNEGNIKLNNLRKRQEIARLYYEYHFNPDVKTKGAEMKQFEVSNSYIQLVEDVQKCMMVYIVQRNLSIETNPTSNYLIGTIGKYVKHPIVRWYNLGLESNVEKIQESPQMSVSINTDDAGIFSTTLENEYALMAIALEKEKDENGNSLYKPSMIYDWLDRIRKMGLEQSFKK